MFKLEVSNLIYCIVNCIVIQIWFADLQKKDAKLITADSLLITQIPDYTPFNTIYNSWFKTWNGHFFHWETIETEPTTKSLAKNIPA